MKTTLFCLLLTASACGPAPETSDSEPSLAVQKHFECTFYQDNQQTAVLHYEVYKIETVNAKAAEEASVMDADHYDCYEVPSEN